MQQIKLFSFFFLTILFASCGNLSLKRKAVENDSVKKDNASSQLIDTGKLKSDMNNIMNAIGDAASGKQPDTNKLKAAAADVISTTASVLSDSGIAKMGGDKNDPSVISAKKMLIKMRNATGITPAQLDSMKKAVQQLQENAPKNH